MVVRPLRRSVRPRAIIPPPARRANQSGKPVKGSTPEPTDAIAPRTPPTGPALPLVAVTSAMAPAFGEAPCVVGLVALDAVAFVAEVMFVPPETLAPVATAVVPPVVSACVQDVVE